MLAVNKVILLGPVYQIKKIETKSGKDMVAFTLKTWRSAGKNEDGTRKEDKKSWHKIVSYGSAATVLEKYLEDGKVIYLEGLMDYYKDKDGIERSQVILESFSFISGDNNQASA
jgi:single stranded DNA-binding protein